MSNLSLQYPRQSKEESKWKKEIETTRASSKSVQGLDNVQHLWRHDGMIMASLGWLGQGRRVLDFSSPTMKASSGKRAWEDWQPQPVDFIRFNTRMKNQNNNRKKLACVILVFVLFCFLAYVVCQFYKILEKKKILFIVTNQNTMRTMGNYYISTKIQKCL